MSQPEIQHDLQLIRAAIFSGQRSRAKIAAQGAFERLYIVLLTHPAPANVPSLPRSTSEVVNTWNGIKEIFHILWADARSGKYDKPRWLQLQTRLWRLESATESLTQAGREDLVAALSRLERPQ